MLIAYIIGIILNLIVIYLLKGSRYPEVNNTFEPYKPERPVLKVWSLILIIMGFIPIFNLITAYILIMYWSLALNVKSLKYTRSIKFLLWLNKPIT